MALSNADPDSHNPTTASSPPSTSAAVAPIRTYSPMWNGNENHQSRRLCSHNAFRKMISFAM